jgi:hypothetical protein
VSGAFGFKRRNMRMAKRDCSWFSTRYSGLNGCTARDTERRIPQIFSKARSGRYTFRSRELDPASRHRPRGKLTFDWTFPDRIAGD